MKYSDLDIYWKKIFDLDWQSVCEGSKAIAALLVDENGNIIGEARNQVGEKSIPNPRVCHAETECIRNLDISKYPNLKAYTLFCALEPCPMCMGTAAMSGIHNFVIACRDDYGGAMELAKHNKLLQRRNFNITWLPQEFGDIQRGFQFIKELLYETNASKLREIEEDFCVYNPAGVKAAKKIVEDGWFKIKRPSEYTAQEIFDNLAKIIEEFTEVK
jgi:tRNA(Arg) A34 adenosine deaminase TadA